jgi:hypothetical protein
MRYFLSLLFLITVFPASAPVFAEDNLIIKGTGDIEPYSNYPPGKFPRPAVITNLLDGALPYLRDADLVIGNFEGAITANIHSSKDMTKSRYLIAFRYPPADTEALIKKAGFTAVQLANNHGLDFGEAGLADTLKAFKSVGIDCVGLRGGILYRKFKNIRTAVIGFHYTGGDFNNMYDTGRALALVREAKTNADVVVITIHAGGEGQDHSHVTRNEEIFLGEHRGDIYAFAHKVIDAGADCLIGFSPHVMRGMEMYKGHVIAYSMGNFMGYAGELSREGVLANSGIIELHLSQSGEFVSGRLIPLRISEAGTPVYDSQKRSIDFVRGLSEKDFPESGMEIGTNGEFIKK